MIQMLYVNSRYLDAYINKGVTSKVK